MKSIAAIVVLFGCLVEAVHADEQRQGPFGGNGGKPYSKQIPVGARMHSIQVFAGRYVDRISFAYERVDGEIKMITVGGPGGDLEGTINLRRDVRLIGISGTADSLLDSLSFHFSDGSKKGPFGTSDGGKFFSYFVSKKDGEYVGQIVGFYGRSGAFIDQIGPIVKE